MVTTNGSMQAIILATQAYCPNGESVVVEEYCYSGTLGVLRQYGAHVQGALGDRQPRPGEQAGQRQREAGQ